MPLVDLRDACLPTDAEAGAAMRALLSLVRFENGGEGVFPSSSRPPASPAQMRPRAMARGLSEGAADQLARRAFARLTRRRAEALAVAASLDCPPGVAPACWAELRRLVALTPEQRAAEAAALLASLLAAEARPGDPQAGWSDPPALLAALPPVSPSAALLPAQALPGGGPGLYPGEAGGATDQKRRRSIEGAADDGTAADAPASGALGDVDGMAAADAVDPALAPPAAADSAAAASAAMHDDGDVRPDTAAAAEAVRAGTTEPAAAAAVAAAGEEFPLGGGAGDGEAAAAAAPPPRELPRPDGDDEAMPPPSTAAAPQLAGDRALPSSDAPVPAPSTASATGPEAAAAAAAGESAAVGTATAGSAEPGAEAALESGAAGGDGGALQGAKVARRRPPPGRNSIRRGGRGGRGSRAAASAPPQGGIIGPLELLPSDSAQGATAAAATAAARPAAAAADEPAETVRVGAVWNAWAALHAVLHAPPPAAAEEKAAASAPPADATEAGHAAAAGTLHGSPPAGRRRRAPADAATPRDDPLDPSSALLLPVPLLCNPGVTQWTRRRLSRLPPHPGATVTLSSLLRPPQLPAPTAMEPAGPATGALAGGEGGDAVPPSVALARELLARLQSGLDGGAEAGGGVAAAAATAAPPPTAGSPPAWWVPPPPPAGGPEPPGLLSHTTPDGRCSRAGCGAPALRLSRYCGAGCGMWVARARLVASLQQLLAAGGAPGEGSGQGGM